MSVISQKVAENIAAKMTEKLSKEIEQNRVNLKSVTTTVIKSYIPKDILAFFKKRPNYVHRRSSFYFSCHGLEGYYACDLLPEDTFTLTAVDAKKIYDAELIMKKNQEKLKQLKIEIAQTLLALKTYNNIKLKFKEASKFLPAQQTMALVVNVDAVRDKMKNYLPGK